MSKNALGYNKSEYKKAVQGLASIKTGKTHAVITFEEEDLHFDNGKNSKKFALDELPETPKLPTNMEEAETYFVKLDRETASEVQVIGPAEGVFSAKAFDFSRPEENADPLPYEITPKKGDPYKAFNVYYKITDAEFKGCVVTQFLHYKFAESGDNPGYAAWDGNPENPKAKWLPRLIEFCEKHDLVAEPIEWPEDGNVLPELLSRLLSKKREVKVVIKQGYISELVSGGKSKVVEEEDEDEKPRKKSKNKAKDEDDDL